MRKALTKKIVTSLIALLPGLYACSVFAVGYTSVITPSVIDHIGNQLDVATAISANGRMVAFSTGAWQSEGGKIYPGNIFLYDKVVKNTRNISVGSVPNLSADGRFLTFVATVPCEQYLGSSNPYSRPVNDILLYDNQTKKTTCISKGPGSDIRIAPGFTYEANRSNPSISADGRYVAYSEKPIVLFDSDTKLITYVSDSAGVVLYDRETKQTALVNVNSNGTPSFGFAYEDIPHTAISADGRYIAFDSAHNNLVTGDTNDTMDIFIHDRQTKQTTRVSVNSSGNEANFISSNPSISADGRYVAFLSLADNLVNGDTNGFSDIFVHDRITGQTSRVSVASNGTQQNGYAFSPQISADGRFVTFYSGASNLAASDTNATYDVFIHDRQTKKTILASGVAGNSRSHDSRLSADGSTVAFWSLASNLSANDSNGIADVFINERTVNTAQQTELAISSTTKPASIVQKGQGDFLFTVKNNSSSAVNNVRIQHLIADGQRVSLSSSQGSCKPYSSLSLCSLGNLVAGGTITVAASIKPTGTLPVRQSLSVSSDAFDTALINNYLTISTPVR